MLLLRNKKNIFCYTLLTKGLRLDINDIKETPTDMAQCLLNLCILMDSFWFDTINLGWSIVHISRAVRLVFRKKILLSDDLFLP